MKRILLITLVLIATISLTLPAGGQSKAKKRIVDLHGNAVAKGTKCAAWKEQPGGTIVVYMRAPEDVKQLTQDLKKAGVPSEQLPDENFWTESTDCSSQAASKCSQGQCGSGSCTLVTSGGFNYCMCTSQTASHSSTGLKALVPSARLNLPPPESALSVSGPAGACTDVWFDGQCYWARNRCGQKVRVHLGPWSALVNPDQTFEFTGFGNRCFSSFQGSASAEYAQ